MDNQSTAKKVGNNLRIARKNAGLSQQEVATKLQTKQTIYSRYETGKLQLDYDKIIFLCKLFDIETTELFDI